MLGLRGRLHIVCEACDRNADVIVDAGHLLLIVVIAVHAVDIGAHIVALAVAVHALTRSEYFREALAYTGAHALQPGNVKGVWRRKGRIVCWNQEVQGLPQMRWRRARASLAPCARAWTPYSPLITCIGLLPYLVHTFYLSGIAEETSLSIAEQ